MKHMIFLLLALFSVSCNKRVDYLAEIDKFYENKQYDKVEALFNDWKLDDSNDPAYYENYARYLYFKARGKALFVSNEFPGSRALNCIAVVDSSTDFSESLVDTLVHAKMSHIYDSSYLTLYDSSLIIFGRLPRSFKALALSRVDTVVGFEQKNVLLCSSKPIGSWQPAATYTFALVDTVIYDNDLLRDVIMTLQEGIQKFPQRLDFRFTLAQIYQKLNEFENQFQILAEAVRYAVLHSNELLWCEGMTLPKVVEVFIPETLHEYVLHYHRKGTQSDRERSLKIDSLVIQYYPRHSYAWNDIGGYYGLKGDWHKALNSYLKAYEADTLDCIVISNVACTYGKLNDVENSKRYYEMAVERAKDENHRKNARAMLNNLMKSQENRILPK